MAKNVYQIGSGDLTFELIERIINENLKLELSAEAKERIQKCRDYLDKKAVESKFHFTVSLPDSVRFVTIPFLRKI